MPYTPITTFLSLHVLASNPHFLHSRRCGNNHGLIRKYGLMMCRRCFRERAEEIGFLKMR